MDSGQVTLIFRQLEKKWSDEYALNILAALATNSNFSHVEVAIGDDAGAEGQMSNVLRIFNDAVGVELAQRTGKSPNFQYLQLGCSKQAERAMLRFAHEQRGKPFSMTAMIRSVVWPRKTNLNSYFCAELVAATLQAGNLMSADSNAGAATPRSLYDMYSKHAAATGNPCTMRSIMTERGTSEEHQPLLRGNFFGAILPGMRSAPARAVAKVRSGHPSPPPPPQMQLHSYQQPARQSCTVRAGPAGASSSFRPLQLHLPAQGALFGGRGPPPLSAGGLSRAEAQIRNAVRGAHVHGGADSHLAVAMYMPITNGLRGAGGCGR